jgi:hypothetical protein
MRVPCLKEGFLVFKQGFPSVSAVRRIETNPGDGVLEQVARVLA